MAAIPLRTNSTTAWDDWQSQIPEAVLVYRHTATKIGYMAQHTVTGNDKELIVVCKIVDSHVWVGSHDLLFGRELGALLEFEITDGTRKGEVAVDTAEVDETTCSADTGLLACDGVSTSLILPMTTTQSSSTSIAPTFVLGLVIE